MFDFAHVPCLFRVERVNGTLGTLGTKFCFRRARGTCTCAMGHESWLKAHVAVRIYSLAVGVSCFEHET